MSENFAMEYYAAAVTEAISEHEYETAQKMKKVKSNIVGELFKLSNAEITVLAREIIFADEMLAEKLSNAIRVELQDNDLSGVRE